MAFNPEQERQARARIDELAILRHAQHLKAILGRDRAEQALQAALREISRKTSLSIRSASRPCKTMIAASSISGVRRPGPNGILGRGADHEGRVLVRHFLRSIPLV